MPGAKTGRADGPVDHQACLTRAIAQGELSLAYQAEFDLGTRTSAAAAIVAVEALCRWRDAAYGDLDPAEFIPLLEQSDLMPQLNSWVIDTALADLTAWRVRRPDLDIVLRLNVSPAQLIDPQTPVQFAAALEQHGVQGRSVCVEITERSPLGDLRALAVAIGRLRELGVACAIDDLASGYSTLGALRYLPVDVVKLDRSLVDGIDADPRARTIVSHILRMAAELGAVVVAEGVEHEREVAALRDLGCTRAQGHHLLRPLDAAGMAGALATRGRRVSPGSLPRR